MHGHGELRPMAATSDGEALLDNRRAEVDFGEPRNSPPDHPC
jgi:hypothetical protein